MWHLLLLPHWGSGELMTTCHYPLSTKTAQSRLGKETTVHAVLTYQLMSH